MAALMLSLFLAICSLRAAANRAEDLSSERRSNVLDIRLPGARFSKTDTHLCHSIRLDNKKPMFITGADPLIDPSVLYHATVSLCRKPGRQDVIWNCGDVETSEYLHGKTCDQEERITKVYTWAHDAESFRLPQGVGIPVHVGTDHNVIVLRMHYNHPQTSNDTLVDSSGVRIFFTTTKPTKLMGQILMASSGVFQPKKLEQCEILFSPPIPANEKMHIFAYRVHTHDLGLMVSGYRIRNGTWTEIGRRSPQLHQNYIPTDVVLSSGDYIAARCTMYNFKSTVVHSGIAHEDEMCLFYIYYYMENGSFIPQMYCPSAGPPSYYWRFDKRLDFENSTHEDGADADRRWN